PAPSLTLASDGNFYGTTVFGGANFAGSVFQLTPAGTLTTIHSFLSTGAKYPQFGVVQAGDGYLYGTTQKTTGQAAGVFRTALDGTTTFPISFPAGSPAGPLTMGTDGNVYGCTAAVNGVDSGALFKLTTDGVFTSYYSFTSTSDYAGQYPTSLTLTP